MALESTTLDGSEKEIKRKPWRELDQKELVERMKTVGDDGIVETGMRSYDPAEMYLLSQIKFSLYGGRQKGSSAVLNGNIHRGDDMMLYTLNGDFKILNEANLTLSDHPDTVIGGEVHMPVQYLKFPYSPNKGLRLQQWVPDSLAYVAECLNTTTVGLYSMCLCYSLSKEEGINVDYKKKICAYVEEFERLVKGKSLKLKMLIFAMNHEVGNTRV